MEKFKKTIIILEKALNALFIAFLILSIVMVGFSVIGLFGGTSLIGKADNSLTFGALELTVSKDVIVTENIDVVLIITSVLTAVRLGLACVLVKLLRNIIVPMKDGTLFVDTVHLGLVSLAKYVFFGGIITSIVDGIGSILIYNCYNIDVLFNSDKVISHSLDINDDGGFLVIAAALYLLSYVFKYGAQLQNQVDETL